MVKAKEGPDQARSWAIAMAGCVINSLLSGVSRTTGLFYVALIETYGVSRMEANMPFTLRNVVRNLSGPLVGAIGQRYGALHVTFVGGVLASLGILLCCFAPNVTWICVLWGGMHGLGVSLGNTLFSVIINQYFLKYRATASGISLSGACVGSFVFPVILEYMMFHLGLSGTFLITGAFLMHALPAALLMKEPSWASRKTIGRSSLKSEGNNTAKVLAPVSDVENGAKDSECLPDVIITKTPPQTVICENVKEEDSFQPSVRNARVFSRSGVDNPAFVSSKMDISEKSIQQVEDEFEGLRLRAISVGESSFTIQETFTDETQETSITKGIAKMLRNPLFYVISVSLAGFAMLFDPSITVIVDYIMDKGLPENDAKYFISMMSFGDLIGRLCFGWVTDKKYMTVSRFMLTLQVAQGICFLLLPWFDSFYVLITIIMVYGLLSGATLVMYPILVAKYLASVQSLSMGFISVITGILSFTVPLLIGYFRDNAGSYDGMFMITGCLSVVVGLIWLLEPLFIRLQKSQRSASVVISS